MTTNALKTTWYILVVALCLSLGFLLIPKHTPTQEHKVSPKQPLASKEPQTDLEVELTCKDVYQLSKPVMLEFSIRNNADKALYILNWQTPFEGMVLDDVFVVRHEEKKCPYVGFRVSRVSPQLDNYLRIEPGQSLSTQFDLRDAYDLNATGAYSAVYDWKLVDVTSDSDSIPKDYNARSRSVDVTSNVIQFRIEDDVPRIL